MRHRHQEESPSLLDRAVGVVVGAIAGAIFYAGWALFYTRSPFDPKHWLLSSEIKWYVLGGAVLGIIGGAQVAKALLSYAFDDLRSDATFSMGIWVGLILFIVAIFVAMKYIAG